MSCKQPEQSISKRASRMSSSGKILLLLIARDALLARCMLSSSVRPSVRHKPVIYRNDRTNRTLASLHPSHTVLWGNLGISKNERTSLWNFVPNSGLSPRQVDRVVNKTRRRRCAVVYYYFLNLGRSSRGGRQKLILEIIALMVSHPSGSRQQSSRAAG